MSIFNCDLCKIFSLKFMIICSNGHSVCNYCFNKLNLTCPFCESSIFSSEIVDLNRKKKINLHLSYFYNDILSGKIKSIDAIDYNNKWYAAKILKIDHNLRKIKVHYYGWEYFWNEWIYLNPMQCLPLYSMTVDFLSSIHIGQSIEFKSNHTGIISWHIGTVVHINPKIVLLKYNQRIFKVALDRNWLCPLMTHCII